MILRCLSATTQLDMMFVNANVLLIHVHGLLRLGQIELLREPFLSLRKFGEATSVVDDLCFGGRHCVEFDVVCSKYRGESTRMLFQVQIVRESSVDAVVLQTSMDVRLSRDTTVPIFPLSAHQDDPIDIITAETLRHQRRG